MLNSVIDIAITLCFTYFLLGLIVSAIKEGISTIQGWRSAQLRAALLDFIDDEWKNNIFPKLENSSFIVTLQKDGKFPSYIPAGQFYNALMDVIRNGKSDVLDLKTIREAIASNDSPITGKTKEMLLTLIDQSENNIDKFRKSVENVFDEAMARVTGWYKRKTKVWLFCISFILTVLLNVDTVNIAVTLWNDPASASKAADQAIELSKQFNNGQANLGSGGSSSVDNRVSIYINDTTLKKDTAFMQSVKHLDTTFAQGKAAYDALQQMPIPIGWTNVDLYVCVPDSVKSTPPTATAVAPPKTGKCTIEWTSTIRLWIFRIIGWLFSTFAISLGAPFWFDLFNKVVNLRGSGAKPKRADGSK